MLFPPGTQPFSSRARVEPPGLPTPGQWLIYSTELLLGNGEWGAGLPQLNLQLPAVALASSVSILDLARRSLRSKSRCFCSRSASRSDTCFCTSASFWRSSVIWVQRQRGECMRVNIKAAEREAASRTLRTLRAQPRPWFSLDFP